MWPQSLCSSADFIQVLSVINMESGQSPNKGLLQSQSPRCQGSLKLGTSPFATTPVPAVTDEPVKESASMSKSRAGVRLTLQRQGSIYGPFQQLGSLSMANMQLQEFSDDALVSAPPLCRISIRLDGCLKVSADCG